MRIVFLCSCLEPGRDGVGDYTRRLAAELVRQGLEVRILALNDKAKIPKPESLTSGTTTGLKSQVSSFTEWQESEGTRVESLRLPSLLSWEERMMLSRRWLHEFSPDWVSLQFVPFGFQPKGLCFGLGRRLKAIAPNAKWHIMFHELWLGLGIHSSVKYRLWGGFQKFIIKDLVEQLQPCVVHTQAEPYEAVLAQEGVQATLLPLFGNIPIAAGNAWADLIAPRLRGQSSKYPERHEFYLAGVFGAVHSEWDPEVAVNVILPLTQKKNQELVLVFFGKSHLDKAKGDTLKSQFSGRAKIILLGERQVADISRILNMLDLGIATTPRLLIQKSGTVAAMIDHGLPALITRDDSSMRGVKSELKLLPLKIIILEKWQQRKTLPLRGKERPGGNFLRKTAKNLVNELTLPFG